MKTQQRNKYLDEHGGYSNRLLTEERKSQLIQLLYPQYDSHFANWSDYNMVLNRADVDWLREQAYNSLKGDPSTLADAVRERMMRIVGGYFPLQFIGWWEVAEKP